MKKILIISLAAVIAICVILINQSKSYASSFKFQDVGTDQWFFSSIEQAVNKGYVDGFPDGTFKPNKKVTHAEFLKLICAALNLPIDLELKKNWYTPYEAALVKEGIYNYEFEGKMDKEISRNEMAKLAVRAGLEDNGASLNGENDGRYMYEATRKGIISGFEKGELKAGEFTTRAQSITVIERILTIRSGGTLKVDKHAVNRAEVLWHGTNAFSMMEYAIGKDDPRWKQIEATLNTFNPANMTIENPVGKPKVKKVIDAILWVDLDDPQDPNRNLIPVDARLLPYAEGVQKTYYVKDFRNAFAVITQGREVVNENVKSYPGNDKVFIAFKSGVEIDIPRWVKGDIEGQGALPLYFEHIGEANDAIVISKEFEYFPTIESYIISQSLAQTYKKTIFQLSIIK